MDVVAEEEVVVVAEVDLAVAWVVIEVVVAAVVAVKEIGPVRTLRVVTTTLAGVMLVIFAMPPKKVDQLDLVAPQVASVDEEVLVVVALAWVTEVAVAAWVVAAVAWVTVVVVAEWVIVVADQVVAWVIVVADLVVWVAEEVTEVVSVVAPGVVWVEIVEAVDLVTEDVEDLAKIEEGPKIADLTDDQDRTLR